ncbi:MAG TPA: CAP domain-containing protein [Candidatus Binataceae bacterium]|nr:CAP domain-containing protein [Candidatus Binataceae bacterium]
MLRRAALFVAVVGLGALGCAPTAPSSNPPPAALAVNAAPSETPSRSSDAGQPEWLARFNTYRAAAGLHPVKDDTARSTADMHHARYLVKNRAQLVVGAGMHSEDKNNPWYTVDGYWAGQLGDVLGATSMPLSESDAIDGWLGAPFHGLAMMAPDLEDSGFGHYCEGGYCAAVLSVGHLSHLGNFVKLKSDEPTYSYDSDAPDAPKIDRLETPVEFPPSGFTISSGFFSGREWPDPLSACDGYTPPTGAIAFASFGRDFVPQISVNSITCDGQPLAHCLVTADTYRNPDPKVQQNARNILKFDAAALVIPRLPLEPGATCEVLLTENGQDYRWSFKVSGGATRPMQ